MKNKGIIAINKPKGWTSFDVVNKLKHILKPHKVGHLGTLDPMATGVLLVTVGKATKLFDLMQEKTKTYLAEFEFGFLTDTLDSTGKVIERTDVLPNKAQIEAILDNFIGEIEQIPPKYSAKSINGKRAYVLARNNVDFELKAKKVVINDIKLISFKNNSLQLKISCGSGTYIRSIGRDIAMALNSLATMTSLVRTSIDNIELKDCCNMEDINAENIDSKIVKIKDFLKIKDINLTETDYSKILNGQTIATDLQNGIYKLNDSVDCVAIVKVKDFMAKMAIYLG